MSLQLQPTSSLSDAYFVEHPNCPSFHELLDEHLSEEYNRMYEALIQKLGYNRKGNPKQRLEQICKENADYRLLSVRSRSM